MILDEISATGFIIISRFMFFSTIIIKRGQIFLTFATKSVIVGVKYFIEQICSAFCDLLIAKFVPCGFLSDFSKVLRIRLVKKMHVLFVVLTLISLFIYNIIQSVILFLTPKKYRKKKDIKGQKVLITGAGNGLGRQLAIQFSKLSTCLILLDINKKSLVETAKLLHPNSRVLIYECDITNRIMVYAIAKRIKDDVGEVDILVNNAGIVNGKSLIDLPDDNIIMTLEVNAISHFWICKSFLPSMMARDRGHIVTVASVAGEIGLPKLTDYCASKHAAIGFSESLELEMQAKNLDGIKVTIVYPAVINKGLSEGPKTSFVSSLTPEYVASEIVEGVLEEKEAIYLPHYFIYLLWLKSISPRWLYRSFLKATGNMTVMDDISRLVNNPETVN